MRSIDTIADMKAAARTARSKQQKLAFVPTMGALHEGHLSLVRRAKDLADIVVMSIFVNPTQFGPQEDFAKYPRDLAHDAGLAAETGVDILFTPQEREIYPPGSCSYVSVEGVSDRLEGAARPGHFRGVATVVLKLFHIVTPDVAVFGQKDAQQVAVVKRLAHDFNLEVEIVVAQTIRDKDGLALSSRNVYLTPAERQAALVLHSALRKVEGRVAEGHLEARGLVALMLDELGGQPRASVEYADVVAPDDFASVTTVVPGAVAVIAATFGSTRLIDNVVLHPPQEGGR